jgi:predicted Zn finger-like uncharacterized protein
MKIICNSCQSKYTVSDEKVQGKTVKIKCRKCGATILVNSSGATTTNASDPAVAAADAAAAADGPTYLVNVADGDQRSMSLQELVQAVNASTITRDTYVWADGMADWQPLTQVQSIVDALNASGGAAGSPEPARPAAKREGGRGASRDLFGGDAQDAPNFSAPKAPAPVRIGAGTEEQSALFSLSALTSRVGSSGPSASAASAGPSLSALASSSGPSKPLNTEDSGLIDLKALAASVQASKESAASAAPSLLDDPGGLFQMSAPSMTTATAAPTVSTPEPAKPQKNRTPLYIGIGAVLAVGAMIGVFMIASGSPPPPETTAQTNPTAANTPPPLDTAPPAVTTAAPADTAAASASALAASGKAPVKSGTGKPVGKAGPAPAPGPGPAPAPAPGPKPAGSPCGCAPSDLMCNMSCSAKKKK